MAVGAWAVPSVLQPQHSKCIVSFLVYNCFILKFFILKVTLVCYNLMAWHAAEGPGSMFAGENFKYLRGLKWIDSAAG